MSAKWRWTIAIVGLLAANVMAMIILAIVASVGQSEVIPDYYARATHYDDTMAQARTNVALGWTVSTSLAAGQLEVTVVDRAGAPIERAVVQAVSFPRAHAAQRRVTTLVAVGGGRYRAVVDGDPGIHDVGLVIDAAGSHYAVDAVVVAR